MRKAKSVPVAAPPPPAPPPAPPGPVSLDERLLALGEWVSAIVDVVGVNQVVARMNERARLRAAATKPPEPPK